jgi:DNA-binding response OmpR family regulator
LKGSGKMAKILIVDDDKEISGLISLILKKENIESDVVNNPLEVLKKIDNHYDLILLDIMMPEMSGTELCLKIRNKVNVPIIFISAKSEIIDKMVCYEMGGDDYITKPFDNTELILKIKSYLRLNKRSFNKSDNLIVSGDITLNKESFEVKKDNKLIELSTREFELLKYLMENAGIALSKEQIFTSVWGDNYGDIGAVAVNIKSLRDKIGEKYIVTIWGYGYKFVRIDPNEEC